MCRVARIISAEISVEREINPHERYGRWRRRRRRRRRRRPGKRSSMRGRTDVPGRFERQLQMCELESGRRRKHRAGFPRAEILHRPDLDHSWSGSHIEANFNDPAATIFFSPNDGFVLRNDMTTQGQPDNGPRLPTATIRWAFTRRPICRSTTTWGELCDRRSLLLFVIGKPSRTAPMRRRRRRSAI